MKNVSVKPVRVMTLLEANELNEKQLGMVLGILKKNRGQLWYLGKGMQKVDLIDAVFKDSEGSNDEPGKLTVWISLLAGQSYEAPYVTVDGDQHSGQTEIEGIEFVPEKDESILKLTFHEPGKDEQYYYSDLYFHTTAGVIDPAVSVRRGVGQ